MNPAITIAVITAFDVYDEIARRREIATLDEEAKREAVELAVARSEAEYRQASKQLRLALLAKRERS